MAGKVVVSTLNDDTGVLATQNGMTGIAKAWVNFNGTSGASPVIRASFNVSSVTRNGTGDYTVSFTTAMPNANYAVAGTAQETIAAGAPNRGMTVDTTSTTNVRAFCTNFTSVQDAEGVFVVIFSS